LEINETTTAILSPNSNHVVTSLMEQVELAAASHGIELQHEQRTNILTTLLPASIYQDEMPPSYDDIISRSPVVS
jgi:hypothetical protein